MEIKIEGDFYIFNCPQCNDEIIVHKNEMNCRIFRHAVYKHNYEQVNPHLCFEDCKRLVDTDSVFGCALPFEIIIQNGKYFAIKCGYK